MLVQQARDANLKALRLLVRGAQSRDIAGGLFQTLRAQETVGRAIADRLVGRADQASEQGGDARRLMAQQGAAGPERGFEGSMSMEWETASAAVV